MKCPVSETGMKYPDFVTEALALYGKEGFNPAIKVVVKKGRVRFEAPHGLLFSGPATVEWACAFFESFWCWRKLV